MQSERWNVEIEKSLVQFEKGMKNRMLARIAEKTCL
jgi:hypothetical protein